MITSLARNLPVAYPPKAEIAPEHWVGVRDACAAKRRYRAAWKSLLALPAILA